MCPETNFICTQREVWTLMDTDYHPKIKFQSTADFGGEENSWKKRRGKKTLLSVWDDVFKGWGGGKKAGVGFSQDCLELHLSALAIEMRRRGSCIITRWKWHCFLFFFFFSFFKCDTGWTQYRRILSCVCLVKDSVTEKSEKCGETRTWSRWVDQGLGLSLQKQSTRWNTGPTAVSLVWLKTVNVHFAVVIIYI